MFITFLCPLVLYGCQENDLSEGNHLAEDKPQVDHLDVGGGGQALHLADEDRRHHQHGRQVHTQGGLKEEGLEEGGGECDSQQKEGGKVCCHQLTCDLPTHYDL